VSDPQSDEAQSGEAQSGDAPLENGDGAMIDDETLVLPKQCKLPKAEELKELFRTIPSEGELLIDASHVEQIGSAGVLAVASLIHTRHEAALKTAIKGATPPVIDGFKDMGLFKEIMKLEFRE